MNRTDEKLLLSNMASNDSYPTGNASSRLLSPSLLPRARLAKKQRTTSPSPSPKIIPPTNQPHDDTYTSFLSQASTRNGFPSTNSPSALNLNPALLLNPKGYGASASASKDVTPNSIPSTGRSTPIEFQFSTPNDGYAIEPRSQSHGSTPLTNGHHTPQTNGFGGMIERMNNIEHRTFTPQPKRRKLQNEENMDSSHGFNGRSGGVLGEHIKERREAGANYPTLKTVETVDLTVAGELFPSWSYISKLTCYR